MALVVRPKMKGHGIAFGMCREIGNELYVISQI